MSEMPARRIVCIAEGHGDGPAVLQLMERWIVLAGRSGEYRVDKNVIRAAGRQAITCPPKANRGVEYYVALAARTNPDGILIVFDGDDECTARRGRRKPSLGQEITQRASRACRESNVAVVVAEREFEAWFLEHWDLLGRPGTPSITRPPHEIADCKKVLRAALAGGYKESIDQQLLAKRLPLPLDVPSRGSVSRSFERLIAALATLVPPLRGSDHS